MQEDLLQNDFASLIRAEGIKCHGYGILPKFVMLDPDLKIESKAIYAFFCAYSGAGQAYFPSRDRIVSYLQINKDTYYKHLKALIANGYLDVRQARTNRYARNIYTIVSNPKKFALPPESPALKNAYSRIRFGGLEAAGYGIIPRVIFQDERLPLTAKAIYAYFSVFTGSGESACPSKDVILAHLKISNATYYKYFRLLIDCNYITTVQRHLENGRMSINDYYLNNKPDASLLTPSETSIQKKDDSKPFSPCAKFSDTEISDAEKPDTEPSDTVISDAEISDTYINNTTINKFINTSTVSNNPSSCLQDGKEDWTGLLYAAGTLPQDFLSDRSRLTSALKIMTDYVHMTDPRHYLGENAELERSIFLCFFDTLLDMLLTTSASRVGEGLCVTGEQVYERLVRLIEVQPLSRTISIDALRDQVMQDYENACRHSEIRSTTGYMRAVIWNALTKGQLDVLAALHHDYS